jgi:hypothetical protein
MSTHDQAVAIYAEMRKLDLERVNGQDTADDDDQPRHFG